MRSSPFHFFLIAIELIIARRGGIKAFSPASTLTNITTGQQSITALGDSMTDLELGPNEIRWFNEVTSTMDKARELVGEVTENDLFAVVADYQSKGRGTRGRTWISGANNLMITVSIPLHKITIPLTLTPLRIGTLVRPSIASRVAPDVPVHLKWPNDILVDDKKVCGTLIELDNNRMLVGIGCNIGSAPSVEATGQEGGRPSACLADYSPELKAFDRETVTVADELPHKQIAKEIYFSIKSWLSSTDSAESIVNDFQSHMSFDVQRLRENYLGPDTESGDVIPLRINLDGTLQVRFVRNGEEKALIADYLW